MSETGMNSLRPVVESGGWRSTDPDTSRDAALSVTDLRERQEAVLRVLRSTGPLADEELVNIYYGHMDLLPPQSPSGIRTRRSELVRKGLVRYAGYKRLLRSGRAGRVWEVAE